MRSWSVFADTISDLTNNERRFKEERDKAKSDLEKDAKKYDEVDVPPEVLDDIYDRWREDYEYIFEWHEGIRPLLARYATLVMVVSMVEWHAKLISKHEIDEICMFLKFLSEEKPRRDDGRNLLQKAIEYVQTLRQPGTFDVLKKLAKKAEVSEDSNEMLTHKYLVVVRNAIVHCGGSMDMNQKPDKCEQAAKFLKFKIADSIPLDDGKQTMKLHAKYILIGAGELNQHIEAMETLLEKLRARPYL